MSTHINQYFLFGDLACEHYDEGEFDKIKDTDYSLYYWDKHSTPTEILQEYDGWGNFQIISKDEYEILLEHL